MAGHHADNFAHELNKSKVDNGSRNRTDADRISTFAETVRINFLIIS